MLDLERDRPFTDEELKARAMARLSAQGAGLAERLANVERLVYNLFDSDKYPLTKKEIVDTLGDILVAADAEYDAEKEQNKRLVKAVEYEQAQRRLAEPEKSKEDFPDVENSEGGVVENPEIARDRQEREAAQRVIDTADASTIALVTLRQPAEEIDG